MCLTDMACSYLTVADHINIDTRNVVQLYQLPETLHYMEEMFLHQTTAAILCCNARV